MLNSEDSDVTEKVMNTMIGMCDQFIEVYRYMYVYDNNNYYIVIN